MNTAYYTLIRYCPNIARGEGANVGIAIVAPDRGLRVKFAKGNERVKTLFLARSYDERHLNGEKASLALRLSRVAPTLEAVQKFFACEGGHLVADPLRMMSSENIDADLERMFDELVGDDPRHHRHTRRLPDLEGYFSLLPNVERDVTVSVPDLQPFVVPFAYNNGCRNYIRPHTFNAEAIREAKELGADGYLVSRAKLPDGREQRVVIVARFDEVSAMSQAKTLLEQMRTKVVLEKDLRTYALQVGEEAHKIE